MSKKKQKRQKKKNFKQEDLRGWIDTLAGLATLALLLYEIFFRE